MSYCLFPSSSITAADRLIMLNGDTEPEQHVEV